MQPRTGIVLAAERRAEIIDGDIDAAYAATGLKPGAVDFGTLDETRSIIVYEYGLYLPYRKQSFFVINRRLYVNGGVIFQTDREGETVPLETLPDIRFMSADEVLVAIEAGSVILPVVAIDGRVIWKWPDPQKGMGEF